MTKKQKTSSQLKNRVNTKKKTTIKRTFKGFFMERQQKGKIAILAVVLFAAVGAYLLIPSFASASVSPSGTYTDWNWTNANPNGYTSREQIFTVEDLNPTDTSYFWAHQFGFINGDAGYFGLQPYGIRRADNSLGKMAIFSIWQATASRGPACGSFSGEGVGQSCSVAYSWVKGRSYRMRMTKTQVDTQGTWWGVWIQDQTTGVETPLGEIQVPLAWKGTGGWANTWTEYYGSLDSCNLLPYSRIRFSTPTLNGGLLRASSAQSYLSQSICTNSSIHSILGGVVQEMGTDSVFLHTVKVPIRIKAGGAAFTDSSGNAWQSDNYYLGGDSYVTQNVIASTNNQTLYQSERNCIQSYNVPLANGKYKLRLHFAELYQTTAGQRIFNVTAEDQTILNNFDIIAKTGSNFTADMEEFNVQVSDGMLNVKFMPITGGCAIISGVEILTQSTTSPAVKH